jgi:hypothetical protein
MLRFKAGLVDSTPPTVRDLAFTTFIDAVIICYRIRCFPCLLCWYRQDALVHALMVMRDAVAVCVSAMVSATGAKAERSASYAEWILAWPEALFAAGTPYFKLHLADGAAFTGD